MAQTPSHRPSGGKTKSMQRFVPTVLTGQLCDVCWDLRDSPAVDLLNTGPIRNAVVHSDENFQMRQFCTETRFINKWKLLRADVSDVTLSAHAENTCKPVLDWRRLTRAIKRYRLRLRASASCVSLTYRQASEPAAQRGTHTHTHTTHTHHTHTHTTHTHTHKPHTHTHAFNINWCYNS